MRHLLLSSVLFCAATLAQADDTALVLGVSDYRNFDDISASADVLRAGRKLGDLGFTLHGNAGYAADGRTVQGAANAFAASAADSGRMIAVLSGQFVTDGTRTWYLADNAARPGPFTVEQQAISVETVLALLAGAPGLGVLVLGYNAEATDPLGPTLRAGVGTLDIPSGVTVVQGRSAAVAGLLDRTITVPGGDLVAEIRRNDALTISGFVPDSLIMVPSFRRPGAAPLITTPTAGGNSEPESWAAAQRGDTQANYTAYLDRYPTGPNASRAAARLQELRDPNRGLRTAEDALNLPLEARRAIQRDLQVLGYDTRGIDGIFGPGTRAAIRAWQAQNNAPQNGFLVAGQIRLIDQQAANRSAELEAQAEARRATELQADRNYWQQTGSGGSAEGLRTYLQRYPDGQFAADARTRLNAAEQQNRTQAAEADRALWDRTVQTDNTDAYRAYLNQQTNGAFRGEAEARIAALEQARNAQASNEAALARERALSLDPISLRLIEARLQQLGLNPGAVDGNIDNDTRAAIRRYQRDRTLTASGYLDQATVSQMLTDAFR